MSLNIALAPRGTSSQPVLTAATQTAASALTGTTARPRLRLTRRGRAVRNAFCVALGATAAIVAANAFAGENDVAGQVVAQSAVQAASTLNAAAAGGTAASLGLPQAYTIVEHGESLWSIAAERTAPGGDVRVQMSVIRSANDIQGDYVYAGQVLLLPAVR
ncbi:LysM peptidoglycan-binding domain-containing protein [Micrococcales bacterium 31B]|nr:LysM peptidoglycan-binding domain-containing protein [Micrococcales bacterium 31B]